IRVVPRVLVAFTRRDVKHRDSLRRVIAVPAPSWDDHELTRRDRPAARSACLEDGELRLPGKDDEQLVAVGVSFPGRAAREAADRADAIVERELADRAFGWCAEPGDVDANHPAQGLGTQIVDDQGSLLHRLDAAGACDRSSGVGRTMALPARLPARA